MAHDTTVLKRKLKKKKHSSAGAKRRPTIFDSEAARYGFGAVMMIVIGLMIYSIGMRRREHGRPELCPWDGSLAQWTTRRADGFCDYGHSKTRSASHTWRGVCPDGMKPLGGDGEKGMRPAVRDGEKSVRPQ